MIKSKTGREQGFNEITLSQVSARRLFSMIKSKTGREQGFSYYSADVLSWVRPAHLLAAMLILSHVNSFLKWIEDD